jgi:DNA-binding response OmpR family regulator
MSTSKPRVVLVEDDERITSLLIEALGEAEFALTSCGDLAGGRAALEAGADLLLLDLGLPDGDGLELCREMRASGDQTPVIVLTARGEPTERVRGLEAGADDYLAKPFHLPELVARIQAVLRRVTMQTETAAEPGDRLTMGPIWLDTITRRVGVGDQNVALKKREFELLEFFLRNPERAWTRLQLLEQVWGDNYACELRAVDLNVARLRAQLEQHTPRLIHTVWGVGYRMSLED